MGVSVQKPPPWYLETVQATGIDPTRYVIPPDVIECTNVKYRKITKAVWDKLNETR